MKKFDFCIGNPPYQEEQQSQEIETSAKNYAPQVYNLFMDEAYKVADTVELIHPARFLFNAGSTSKAWNEKMLSDPHIKVLLYEADSKKVFANRSIPGGIAVTYRDSKKHFGGIGTFTNFEALNSILHRVKDREDFASIEPLVVTRTVYRLTQTFHDEHPEAIKQLSDGHAFDMSSNIFDRIPQVFFEICPEPREDYIRMYGRKNGNRTYMFIQRKYVKNVHSLDKYKVVLAQSDGASGTIGNPVPARVIGAPVIEGPGTGTTESFISIGAFDMKDEALNAMKYVKTKFARTLVSVLKVTQAIPPEKWKYVPLQDFTPASDIDWSRTIAEIDQQLYKKYGLSNDEIDFIETHVKEMN